MASKLKIFSLGGLNEIGKNITVFEYGNDLLIVDCGLGFPDDDMYGIDIVIPDFSFLEKNADRIRGLVLTHGHEDHIGAVPYLLELIKDIPVYATKLTAALLTLKLDEHKLTETTSLTVIEAGKRFRVGVFDIEPIHVNHSIADTVSLAIKTPIGMVIHTADFKIDVTPIHGDMINLARFGQLGKDGVLCMLADSTNVEKPGHSVSESKVGARFDQLFKDCDKRIIVTTFASNIHRVQQIINSAAKYGRKVGITGRSLENVMRVSIELGYVTAPEGVIVDMNRIKGLPKKQVVIITTGSQGEHMSALHRMAFSGHRQVEINAGDRVIISASAIPGNERTISRVIDELFHKGAEVVYDRLSDLHVSGHACQEELKMMLALIKPKFFMPVHGEHRHLRAHANLAQQVGVEPKNIIINETGRVLEITRKTAKLNGTVPSGRVLVDGSGVGDVGSVVMRDRRHLAEDGMVVVVMVLSSEDASLISGPDIITRGFIFVKESEELMDELKRVVNESLDCCSKGKINDWAAIKSKVRTNLSGFLYKTTKRSPMILPVIMEI